MRMMAITVGIAAMVIVYMVLTRTVALWVLRRHDSHARSPSASGASYVTNCMMSWMMSPLYARNVLNTILMKTIANHNTRLYALFPTSSVIALLLVGPIIQPVTTARALRYTLMYLLISPSLSWKSLRNAAKWLLVSGWRVLMGTVISFRGVTAGRWLG